MSSSDFITILAAVSVALVTGVTGLAVYFTNRRTASGKVETSEASVLWQQSQDMREMLLAQLGKAEEQRDRLIEAYTGQTLPMLAAINASLQDLTGAVAKSLEGGDRGVAAAQAQEAGPVGS